MGDKSNIEWTDATWNPVVGCSKVSEGCRFCYAMAVSYQNYLRHSKKYDGIAKLDRGRPEWTGEIKFHPQALELPLHWRKPRKIFVNSI